MKNGLSDNSHNKYWTTYIIKTVNNGYRVSAINEL